MYVVSIVLISVHLAVVVRYPVMHEIGGGANATQCNFHFSLYQNAAHDINYDIVTYYDKTRHISFSTGLAVHYRDQCTH
jgi:hypothetical protein